MASGPAGKRKERAGRYHPAVGLAMITTAMITTAVRQRVYGLVADAYIAREPYHKTHRSFLWADLKSGYDS